MRGSITTVHINQMDPRLGRHLVHDEKSRDHAARLTKRSGPMRSVQHRRYDPTPEPNQRFGCCTGVAEAMMGNAVGNRVKGKVLDMDDALEIYSHATAMDPWPGNFPPSDTGSSGLAAAKAGVKLGISTHYEWYFGIDAVLRGLQKNPISIGGYWTWDMFNATAENPIVTFTGADAGGHQWVASGHDIKKKIVWGECWWGGTFGRKGRFGIHEDELAKLLARGGDAHYSYRKMS